MRILLAASAVVLFAAPAHAADRRAAALQAFAEGNATGVRALHADANDVALRNLACAAKLADGSRNDAVACWNSLLADQPRDPAAADNLGALSLHEGDLASAATRFGYALSVDFSDGAALAGLAEVDLARGDAASAAKHALAAISCEPNHLGAWSVLGAARWVNGDAAGAVEAFARVTELDPHNGLGWARLGVAQAAAGRGNAAHASFAKASDWAPDDAAVRALVAGAAGVPHTAVALHLDPGYGVCFAGAHEWVRIRRGSSLTIDASGFVWTSRRASLASR